MFVIDRSNLCCSQQNNLHVRIHVPVHVVIDESFLPCVYMRSRVKRLIPSVCIFICIYIYMCICAV